MKTARVKKVPADYAWARAGLEIKVCPIAMVKDCLVLFRGAMGPQFFLFKGRRSVANTVAQAIAAAISRAIDRELEASSRVREKLAADAARARPRSASEIIFEHMTELEKPRKACRPCREK